MTNTFETQSQQCDVATNSFHVEKPCDGSNSAITLSTEAPTQFEFGLGDVAGFQILDGGALLISFVDGDETLMIENYAEMAQNSSFQDIKLSDGETINLQKLAQGLSSPEAMQVAETLSVGDLANIETAAGGELVEVITKSQEYTLVEGQSYATDFNQVDVETAQVDGDGNLVITFVDETQTIITNFNEIESADDIPTMTLADGAIIPVTDLLTQTVIVSDTDDETDGDAGDVVAATQSTPTPSAPVVREVEEEIAMVRPEDLAAIEPAAGDTGAPVGALGNTGANFGSSVSDVGLGAVNAVGPIGITSLQFDRPELDEDDFFLARAVPGVPQPVLIANQAAGYEDNAINFGVFAQSSDVEECIEVIIEGIPAGWTPDLTDATTASGTFDPIAGTWTLSLGVGESLTTGPIFTPPFNSDEDISPLTVTVNQKDPITLVTSSTATGTFTVLVDAVADDINLTANNVSGTEDIPVQLDIAASLTDIDGSEEITQVLICNVPAGFMLSSGTEVSPGNYLVDKADLATLELTPAANYSGTVSLEVKVTNEEVNFSDTEFDFTNNTNVTTLPFDVTFAPVPDAPTLDVDDVRVKEDGTVDLPIKVDLTDPSEALTIRVENLDNTWGVSIGTNNGVYNAATGVWEITLPAGQNYDGSINLTPPADTDGDMPNITVQAISTESDGSTAQSSEVINVITDAVADAPTLSGSDITGNSGTVYPLNLANALTDTDGSESLGVVTISGVPSGFTLTAGTQVSPGVWEVAQGDVASVGINTPAGYQGGFDLSVSVTSTETPTDTEYDFTDNEATTTIPLRVDLQNPTVNAPTVQIAGEHQVYEDGSITVPFSASLGAGSLPSDVLTVTLSGIDSTWTVQTGANNGTYNPATGTWTITLPAGQDYTGAGLTFTPPANSDVNMNGLVLTATTSRPSNGTSSSADANSTIIVDAVADMPNLNAGNDSSVLAGQSVAINISNDLLDLDGSESLGVVTISGVPAGYSLSAGTLLANGDWEVAQSDLAGLLLNTPVNGTGSISLTASVTATEAITDTDFDFTNNTATNTDVVVITVNPDRNPPEITFGSNGSGQGQVLEDGTVFVPITASLSGAAPQVLTVEVSGIDTSWTIQNADGTYNPTTGVWTITLPEGQDYTGGLTFTPPADSDVDLTGLNVTATSTLVSDNSTSDTSTSGQVIVDAVADMPNVNAGPDRTVEAGQSVAIDVSASLTDVDGSETLSVVTISNVPTGYSLNQGSEVSPGVWELTQAQLNGLVLNTPANAPDGNVTLTVSVTSTESVTDVDFIQNNNTATNTDTVVITVNADDQPQLSNPTPLVVDETDLNPTDTDGNVLTGNFGGDGPGTYEVQGANTFAFNGAEGGNLTSNGVGVVVSVEGNSYVGKAGTEEVFRLDLNETTGQYDFILTGTLDHDDETNPDDIIQLSFGVTAKDNDNDVDNGVITVNVKDDAPIAGDDCNEFEIVQGDKDYNVVLALDISTSMDGQKLDLLKASVSNLLNDFGVYQGGDIKVHITPFSSISLGNGTFTVSDAAGLQDALAYIDGLVAGGTTNYEAPLQSAISWLQGNSANDPIANAETYTYFVSDGSPNRYIDASGSVVSGSAQTVMNEITGSDGTDEVATLQGLSTEVIGVGIDIDGATLARLGQIDSDGNAMDVQNPLDLDAAFQASNPLNGRATGNVLTGQGNALGTSDTLSQDIDNVISEVSFNGQTVIVNATNGAVIDGAYGTLVIQADGSYTYTVTAQNLSGNITENFEYTVIDGDGDTSTADLILKGNYTPVDLPPEVVFGDGTAADGSAQVLEDNSVVVPITASLNGSAPQQLTVEVSGIDTSWTITTGANNGTYNATTGVWTITLPAGQNYNGGLTFTPPADSDVDLTGLVVTATSRNTDTNSERSAVTDGSVIVDAVADMPVINAGADKNVNAGQSVALDVSNSLTDTDGSESLGNVTVSGVPAGYSLNVGTEVSPGVWEVAQGDLANLRLNTPQNGTGSIELTMSVTSTESVTDVDFNSNNNTATNSDRVVINVTPEQNDVPVVTGATEIIDETALVNGVITETGSVSADFGSDGPGYFELTGGFSSTGANNGNLTHNGVDVVVTRSGNTYTGMAGGVTVFTLDVNSNGTYEFNLIESLDHDRPDQINELINLNFGFVAVDDDGDRTNGTIVIAVKDDNPVAMNDTNQVMENQVINGNVLNNDTESSDDPTVVTTVNGQIVGTSGLTIVGQYGTLIIQQDGSYTYTANSNNPDGVDGFTYVMTDADGDSSAAELNITVSSENDTPFARNDVVSMYSCDFTTLGNVMTNHNQNTNGVDKLSDDGGNALISVTHNNKTYTFKSGGEAIGIPLTYGFLFMFTDGSYTYVTSQANPQNYQDEVLTYTIADVDGDQSSAMLTIDVIKATQTSNAAADYGNQLHGTNTTINGEAAYKTDDTDGAMVLAYDGNDVISGNVGNDALYGWTGADTLYGDAGNDVLFGEQGNNELHGGDGADMFVMHNDKAGNNNKFDTIMDFDVNEGDVLSLADVISGFGSSSDINDFVRIRLEGSTAVVQVNSDGQGNDFYDVAKLNSHSDLDATTLNVDDLFSKGHIDVY